MESTSTSTPWIEDYVRSELQKKNQNQDNEENPPRLVQIVSRGGDWWKDPQNTTLKANVGCWLVLSDGRYSIIAHLSKKCRAQIWKHISSPQLPLQQSYWFLEYSRGCCGLLQHYQLLVDDTENENNAAKSIRLVVDQWDAKPGMNDWLKTTNDIMIQPVEECVHVRHALQLRVDQHNNNNNTTTTNSTVVLGNVEEALKNDDLMEQILGLAQEAVRKEEEEEKKAKSKRQIPAQTEDDDDEDDDDEDESDAEEESMNIRDMLATQPEVLPLLPEPEQPSQEEVAAASSLREKPSSLQEEPSSLQEEQPSTQASPPRKEVEASSSLQEKPSSVQEQPSRQEQQPSTQASPPPQKEPPSHEDDKEDEASQEEDLARLSTQPPLQPPLQQPSQESAPSQSPHAPHSKRKATDTNNNNNNKRRRLPFWQSAVRQLSDSTVSLITFGGLIKQPQQLLRHGLSRWLTKNTREE